jgi:murein DD-endopeptidase MepM/ murein hydrolase activator NlpD
MGARSGGRLLLVAAAVAVCLVAWDDWPANAEPSWRWPLAGPPPVTRAFAPPEVRYGAGHRGVDLGGPPAAPVLAAGAGRVSYAGLLAGRGVVVVDHGGVRSTYEPVTADVAVGQQVDAGQRLGRLDAGHDGCPVAACLHWGLRRGETYLDPLSLVGAGRVRLLPVLGERSTDGAADRAGEPAAVGAPVPRQEPPPNFDLRAAVSPSGALAVAALLAGLVLLVRPRPPHRPAGGASARPAVEQHDGPSAPVLDLGHERARRATGTEP